MEFNICMALRALAETNEDIREGTKALVKKRAAAFKRRIYYVCTRFGSPFLDSRSGMAG